MDRVLIDTGVKRMARWLGVAGAASLVFGVILLLWPGISLVALTARLPGCEWCAALLLGGSLSHMIETSRRGRVCDYLCLRFWPAFNLADAAILIGTVGFIVRAGQSFALT